MDIQAIAAALAEPGVRGWLAVAIAEALLFLTVAIVVTGLSRRRIGRGSLLTIKTSDDDAIDEIWMSHPTMQALGLKWGDTIRIQGVGRNAYRKVRHVRLRRRLNLPLDHIELSPDLQVLLFDDLPGGGPLRNFAFAPGVRKGGFEEFWFNPSEQIRFQNRMGVGLGLGLPLFQMVWSLAA